MNFISNTIKWIFGSLSDDTKNTLSLTRVVFLASIIIALKKWDAGYEINDYFYYFILINLSYLFFKYKALDLITKVLDSIITLKTNIKKESNNG